MPRCGLRPPTLAVMVSRRHDPREVSARSLGAAFLAVAVFAAGSSCASTGDGAIVVDDPVVAEEAGAVASAVPAATLPQDPRSEGTVKIGETVYRFNVTCYAPGAGEVVVLGAAGNPASGSLVELYLQAFLGDSYVGLRLADGTRIEPSLDSPLDLYLQDDVVRASAIRFVRDLNLETGEATDVGFGELEIHCNDYSEELPG